MGFAEQALGILKLPAGYLKAAVVSSLGRSKEPPAEGAGESQIRSLGVEYPQDAK